MINDIFCNLSEQQNKHFNYNKLIICMLIHFFQMFRYGNIIFHIIKIGE